MLFKNIGIINENFNYEPDMYVGTAGNRIIYIDHAEPDEKMAESFGDVYDGSGKVLMPGFYNAHGHSPMTLMRGYGESLSLQSWLSDRIFPFEAKLYNKAVYWGTLEAMAESIKTGIVSTSDMYMFVDSMVRAVSVSGEKANVACNVVNPAHAPVEGLQALKDMRMAIEMYDGFEDGRIKTDACLHAEYTSDEATARAVAEAAKEYDVNVHVHVAETELETKECMERHGGLTPVGYLNECGIFDQPTTAAHCVWINDDDRRILKEKGVTVAHNPASNLKLCSGICEVQKLYDAGINVAIGTDSVASNNSLDFFEEMKLMALLGKYRSGDPANMKPEEVLRSATRAGALSQGRNQSGLVKEGYMADLIVVDMDTPNMQPVHSVVNNLVFSASGDNVCLTMVDGQVLYRDGEFETIDVEKVYAETEASKDKILASL